MVPKEDAVARLQRDIADYRKELLLGLRNSRGFTSKPVPRYLRQSSWEQYRQVFAAIACSNGRDVGHGNYVAELASGRLGRGRGWSFFGAYYGISGGVFFLWRVDP